MENFQTVDSRFTGIRKVEDEPFQKSFIAEILASEVELLKSRYTDHTTGHLRTAVSVLEERIKELNK